MRGYFLLCLSLVNIARTIPIATDVSDDTSSFDLIDNSIDSNQVEATQCLSDFSDQSSSDNIENSQSENIFRREDHKTYCPSGLGQVRNTPFKHFDPTQLKPLSTQEDTKDLCASYPDTHLGTCQGPEYGRVKFSHFRYVLNCLQGAQPGIPARRPWQATTITDQYCCRYFHDEAEPMYAGDFCNRVTFKHQIERWTRSQLDKFRAEFRQAHPYSPYVQDYYDY